MSVFGIRQKLKSGIKKVIGGSPTDTTPPNWQSRGPEEVYSKPTPAPAPAPLEEPAPEAAPVAAAPEPAAVPEPAPAAVPEPAPAVAEAAPVAADEASPEATAEASEGMAADDDTAGPPINFDDVQEILDDMVRPALQGDGGDITLLKIEDNDIYVKLVGACSTCPSAIMTMKLGVEALLKEEFPAMRELVQVE